MAQVSLVIPCFNHGDKLKRAVDSALRQSNLREIIIVDDQSTDDSLDIARWLEKKNNLIRCIVMEENSGAGAARNFGVSKTDAPYISFLDADDEFIGDFFGEALALIGRDQRLHAVKGDMEFFDPIKGYILPSFDPRYSSVVLSSACALLMKKNDFVKIGGFPIGNIFRGPQGGEDVAFMQMVRHYRGPLGRVTTPLYRVWSERGSHLDKFLCSTRLTEDSFEFVQGINNLAESDRLIDAISLYSKEVEARFVELDSE